MPKSYLFSNHRITTTSTLVLVVSMLFGIIGSYFTYNLYSSLKNEHHYRKRQITISDLGARLQIISDYLGREARLYSIDADEQHLKNFWHEVNVLKTREQILNKFQELGVPENLWSYIVEAKKYSELLNLSEKRSMIAVRNGDLQLARELLINRKYSDTRQKIYSLIEKFQLAINEKASHETIAASTTANLFFWMSVVLFSAFVLYIYSVCYFFLIKNIAIPVSEISNSMNAIATGSSTVEIPKVGKHKEISELVSAASVFKTTLEENQIYARELALHKENLEELVEERTRDLNEANRELDEFSYRTSHDLRSPLISSIGLLDMAVDALETKDHQMVADCIEYSVESQKKMVRLVEDLLLLTHSKHAREEPEIVDIANLIKTTILHLQNSSDLSDVKILQKYNHTVSVLTQPIKITHIFENLISNAIKYRDTAKPESWISISTESNDNCFTLRVKDNGLGIELKHREKLFLMFERFHANVSYGSGLGLYLVKKTAVLLGGDIEFRENPDGGSEFILTLGIQEEEFNKDIQG